MKKLTNYDKYVLAKQIDQVAQKEETEANCSLSNEYAEYLMNELRRTTPSENRVLRENEFYAQQESGAVAMEAKPAKEHRFKLRKGGKIFLAIYVILMIALASILIVTNTTGTATFEGISFNQSAGAASSDEQESDGNIRAMTIEEESSEETNWFDKLCDSLNK